MLFRSEADIAAHASRVLVMKDGLLQSDERQEPRFARVQQPAEGASP